MIVANPHDMGANFQSCPFSNMNYNVRCSFDRGRSATSDTRNTTSQEFLCRLSQLRIRDGMNNQTPLGMIIEPWISTQKYPVVHMDEVKREGVLVNRNPSKEELAEPQERATLDFASTRLTQLFAASVSQLRRWGTRSS